MADGGDDETGFPFTQPSEAAEIPFTQPTEQKCEVPSVLVDLSSDLEFCLPAAGSKATGRVLARGRSRTGKDLHLLPSLQQAEQGTKT